MKATPPAEIPAVRIEADNERAWCGDRRLELAPRPFAVLRYLVEHPHTLITKDDLLATVWRDAIVSDAALATCIRDLRHALRDSSRTPRYIVTVHRRGFRFIGPITASTAPPAGSPAMPSPQERSPSTAALVGRQTELARLRARLEAAMKGQRQLVFVTGEPGIGKTALVEAFLEEIGGGRALRVGHGQCVEQYGAAEAYLPLLEALGRLGRAEGGDELVRVLMQHAPTWLAQLPALLSDADLDGVLRRAQGTTRDRMLRELVEALDVLSLDTPLVLVLEDLHWSDSATIDVLTMLARRQEAARLLIVGTYRPADVAAAGHPLKAAKQELQVHGRCEELALELLSVEAVTEYLARRFPRHAFPRELAGVLHRNTDGNPLYLVNAIDDLIARGQLREADGQWELPVPVDLVAVATSGTLRQMVDRQVDRLSPGDQEILAVASVAGAEFSTAVAGAEGLDPQDVEQRCEGLARRGQFLRAAGVAEWPDGTVATRYAFIHALYQQALYARVSIGKRVALHRQTGERLERGYGGRAGEIAGELAMHFEHGRDFERAVRYRRRAGENALRQHGYREAAEHARRGLEFLAALPQSQEHLGWELGLQVVLGAALTATRGYAALEAAHAYARARELCTLVEDTRQLLPILVGLGRFYLVRGQFQTAREVGLHLMALAEATGDSGVRLAAHNALGVVSFYGGEFETALVHLERGIELYDPDQHSPNRSPAFRLGQDPGISCTTHAGMALWALGYPARAAARIQEALGLARALGHPFTLSYACHFAAGFHQWRSEPRAVRELEAEALPIDRDHGFGLFLTAGAIYRGWVLCKEGRHEEGIAQMREGLSKHRDIGSEVLAPAFLAILAEVHAERGQSAEGLSAVAEALTAGQQSGQHFWEADLHRLMGTLTARAEEGSDGGTPAAAPHGREQPEHRSATPAVVAGRDAESCFLAAVDIARRQRAKSLELRAATSLSRLWAKRGKAADARRMLSETYAWFTEGWDTADLREAKSLLEELEHQTS